MPRRLGESSDEIVRSTLQEIFLFMMFFFLILLSTLAGDGGGARNGEHDDIATFEIPLGGELGFREGSSEITIQLRAHVRENLIPLFEAKLREYGGGVIDVIGHTDGVPVQKYHCEEIRSNTCKKDKNGRNIPDLNSQRAPSNIDEKLVEILRPEKNTRSVRLNHHDNAGLGLLRAAAVAVLIKSQLTQEFPVEVLPYSAGHAILRGDILVDRTDDSGPNPDRRRIEIRIRKSSSLMSTLN